jgi:hypothetical protein
MPENARRPGLPCNSPDCLPSVLLRDDTDRLYRCKTLETRVGLLKIRVDPLTQMATGETNAPMGVDFSAKGFMFIVNKGHSG